MIVSNSSLIPRPESIVGWAPVMAFNSNADLAGLDPTNLEDGFVMILSVLAPEEKSETWKIRTLGVGESARQGELIISSAAPTRCWVRLS